MITHLLIILLSPTKALALSTNEIAPKTVKILGFDQRQVQVQLAQGKRMTLPRAAIPGDVDLRPEGQLMIPVKSPLWKRIHEAESRH